MVTLDEAGGRIRRKTKSFRRNIPIHQMLIERVPALCPQAA
jgi:hypothetical protein